MRRLITAIAVLAFCVLLAPADEAAAYSGILSDWNTQYPDACADLQSLNCNLCHGGGFSLNSYGADLAAAGNDFAAIEAADSDGDGRTNGQEINEDCSAPGDAASPVEPATWASIKSLFD